MAEQAAIEAKIAAVNRAEVEREKEEERMKEEQRMKEEEEEMEMEMVEAAEKMVAEEVAKEVHFQISRMLPSFLAKMRQVESDREMHESPKDREKDLATRRRRERSAHNMLPRGYGSSCAK